MTVLIVEDEARLAASLVKGMVEEGFASIADRAHVALRRHRRVKQPRRWQPGDAGDRDPELGRERDRRLPAGRSSESRSPIAT
jgi:hypothetical protein